MTGAREVVDDASEAPSRKIGGINGIASDLDGAPLVRAGLTIALGTASVSRDRGLARPRGSAEHRQPFARLGYLAQLYKPLRARDGEIADG